MSDDEDQDRPRPPFAFISMTPEQIEFAKAARRAAEQDMVNFAKAAMPFVDDARKHVRDLIALYVDAPVQSLRNLNERMQRAREELALIRDELEFWAGR